MSDTLDAPASDALDAPAGVAAGAPVDAAGPQHPAPAGGERTQRAQHAAAGAAVPRMLDGHAWRLVLADALNDAPDRRGTVATLLLPDLEPLLGRLGEHQVAEVQQRVADELVAELPERAWLSWRRADRLDVLVPGARTETVQWPMERAARALAVSGLQAGEEVLHLSPVVGMSDLARSGAVIDALEATSVALEEALGKMDLVPQVARPSRTSLQRITGRLPGTSAPAAAGADTPSRLRAFLRRGSVLVPLGYLLGVGLPLLVLQLALAAGIDLSGPVFVVAAAAGVFTCWTVGMEVLHALRTVDPPATPQAPAPPATALIAAYLPNEAATIEETVEAFLRVDHRAGLQVLLAYNSPQRLPVEERLAEMSRRDPRLQLLRVEGSTSKAQNVNAAIPYCRGGIIGVFDADHHPMPDAFERAWEWLGSGYDVVQGHCVVRNGAESSVASLVAVEFEGIYAVSHPGRARWHGFGIFGGSNGYWRREVLRGMRFRHDMLTEDIDSSIRTLTLGGRFASDPYLTSSELAPTEISALWKQRLRWAQGWFQVMRRRLVPSLRADHLTARQKAGLTLLLGWTQVSPWMCMLPLPLVIFALLNADRLDVAWNVPLYLLVGLFSLSVTTAQMVVSYAVAHPTVRRHRGWFLRAALLLPVYAELKNAVVRTAQLQELVGQRAWVVTPRSGGGSR